MKKITNPRIWEFDVDDTLILWDKSAQSGTPDVVVTTPRGPTELHINHKNVNLLKKLAKIGWHVRVHSGSGVEWAEKIVEVLGLSPYVDEVCAKPLGRTDDQAPGDGISYDVYRR